MTHPPRLRFLGGAGTVTGSKHLVTAAGQRILLDCGLFQGLKELRLRNWSAPPIDAATLNAVLLSHAHIDHSGYLPVLVRRGFHGPIFCTPGTRDLVRVLLLDAAHLQEEDAERANRRGYSKHKPALPLFSRADVDATLPLLRVQSYGETFPVADGMTAVFRRAGHILGSATVDVRIGTHPGMHLVFSGDLGGWHRPILRDPELIESGDVVLVESTYGDRTHSPDPLAGLAAVVHAAVARGGALLIPSFAVGRAQTLIWALRRLEDDGRIPALPVYVDSPMAIDVTDIYCQHPEDHDLDMQLLMDQKRCPLCCRTYRLVRRAPESRALNNRHEPMIIISASGMATGGRVLHHLKLRLPDERTTVLLPGFQAAGTRGRAQQEGAKTVRIHGEDVPVRAAIETLDSFSAHADREEILRWLSGFRRPPRATFVVHGEPTASNSLAQAIAERLGWNARVPRDGDVVDLRQ